MRRPTLALAFAAAATALGACSGSERQACPGEPIETFQFGGTRVAAGDPALAGLDPVPAAPDCVDAVGYPAIGEPLPPFAATLAADPGSQSVALCSSRGVVLFGQRSGPRYVVETGTSGAVLGGCAATCTAAMRLVVAGDVTTAPGGEPTAFTGVLVEVMSALEGSACGDCTLPCAARYAVTGQP